MTRITAVIIICLIFSIFMACGSNGVLVTLNTVTEADLLNICDSSLGCAVYGDNDNGQRFCDIYMLPEIEYNPQPFTGCYPYSYSEIIAHELKHCFEGPYHPQ